ncbi:acyl-N-acyltransferase [Micractinium conductrix]|uniref:Acyl-N-acyltransferase n=1 Tax=Micractinium conductrix TaxID=554055 RepID=A0A2P6VS59_9CHLO|nr:acyl-N-acyltransferase [Micractinium conductrix]|eukprot:PSC76924.1 acyl-N-acyltransferase [Micractinium conductrix]
MLRYRVRVPARDPEASTLLITPLTKDWIPAAAEVLTDSFAVSLGAAPYTNFLRRQVKSYLELHCELPPKAVVLVALLLPAELAATEAALAGGDAAGGDGGGAGSGAALSSWQQSGSDLEIEMGDGMAMYPLLGSSPLSGGSTDASSEEGEAVVPLARVQREQQGPQQPQDPQPQDPQPPAAAQPQEPAQQQEGAQPPASLLGPGSGAQMVGVVELSFSASTRSKYITLNPPADRPYLCNMATHPAHRGRGYGFALLKAAEALVVQLGEREVYLHLRVQDEPAAQLYNKAGYEKQDEDSFLVRFMRLDQRRLMRKRLATPSLGAAAAPAAAPEAAAAPAQQPAAAPPKMRLDEF